MAELRTLNAAAGWTDLSDDGGVCFYLQDLIVAPAHQDRGVGGLLLGELWDHLERRTAAGAFVGLVAADGKAGFYERYGFAARAADAPGMWLMRAPGAPHPRRAG